MEQKITLNGKTSSLLRNESDFFESDIIAPGVGGIYIAKVEWENVLGTKLEDEIKIQVLKNIEKKSVVENVLYILDKNTFKIKNVCNIKDFEINVDEETNGKSTVCVVGNKGISYKDFIFIKTNHISFFGIVDEILNEDGKDVYQIICKYISNIFDRKVILKRNNLLNEQGVEDFIFETIKYEFTSSEDTLLNISFLDVEVLTHTKIQKEVENENGIYNFRTFMVNCTQNYNIKYNYKYEKGRLKLEICRQDSNIQNIDANLADITEYTEIFEKNVTAKTTIICEDKSEHSWYLKNDRTVTDNKNDEDRACGNIEVAYTAKVEDAYQTALDIFKSNSYKHMIKFKLNTRTKLYNIENLNIGALVNIKTQNNLMLKTYISAIEYSNYNFITFTTGNIRMNFIDKLKQREVK